MKSDDFGRSRSEFKESFYRLASDSGINLCKEWEASMPDFVPVLVKFFDEKTNRIFTVEQSVEGSASFDYAIRKTGVHFEQEDLLLRYENAFDNMSSILEIYKKWVVEKIGGSEMDEILAKQRT